MYCYVVEGLAAAARADAAMSTAAGAIGDSPAAARARVSPGPQNSGGSGGSSAGGISAHGLRDALHRALKESSAALDPLASRVELHRRTPAELPPAATLDTAFSEHSALMVDFVEGGYTLEWPVSLLLPDVVRLQLAAAQR